MKKCFYTFFPQDLYIIVNIFIQMHTEFVPLQEQIRTSPVTYVCVGCLLITHLILMIVLVTSVAVIAPEVKSTLSDVQVIMPEMRRSLLDLGQMLPEIKTGMNILSQLCTNSETCHVN